MTCKDCIYHERCHSEIAYGMGSDDLTGEYFADIEKRCKGFKNKADFAEVKRGYWIKNKPNPEVMKEFHKMGIGKVMSEKSIFYTCSCCGSWGTPINKYCGICGAKMEGQT